MPTRAGDEEAVLHLAQECRSTHEVSAYFTLTFVRASAAIAHHHQMRTTQAKFLEF